MFPKVTYSDIVFAIAHHALIDERSEALLGETVAMLCDLAGAP